jgi:hypothetical protein
MVFGAGETPPAVKSTGQKKTYAHRSAGNDSQGDSQRDGGADRQRHANAL